MVPDININHPGLVTGQTKISDLIDLLLTNRGITDTPGFLHPPLPDFDSDFTTFKKLVKSSTNILIYGDYDVDGISASAILWQSLDRLRLSVTPFVPHRETDGYGFRAGSFSRFQKLKNTPFDLLITVDNGIVALPEFVKVKKLNPHLKIIVIDHHLPDKSLKTLQSTIDCLVHSTGTSGAGLAYFAAKSLDPAADLGLAALGVVADVLPLTGLNRSLVYHGLMDLRLNPNPGIKSLISVSNLKSGSLTAYDLGFVLGPRINAVGRLSDPTDALRLLCARSKETADKYAKILESHNRTRQDLQQQSIDFADKLKSDALTSSTRGRSASGGDRLIFVSGSYHPGIIGLVAGRLTEKYNLPSVIISTDGQIAKGSCRSVPGLNIIEVLRQFSPLFIDLGGHEGAAGFSINPENIPKLQKKLTQSVNRQLAGYQARKSITVDCQMHLSALKIPLIKAIDQLEPFGMGNPKPAFLFRQLRIVSKRVVGAVGDHLSLKLDDPSTPARENVPASAIAFKKGELDSQVKVGDLIDIIASLDLNVWNGYTTPQLIVKEILQNNTK